MNNKLIKYKLKLNNLSRYITNEENKSFRNRVKL